MVYLLTPMLDDPRFDGFEAPPELFRSTPGGKRVSLNFDVIRLAPNWNTPQVRGTVRDINHYPCINLGTPAFSAHAADCLKELLSENGELLPIHCKFGIYYFYNVTTVADVLDVDRSVISWLKPGIIAGWIKMHAFILNEVDNLSIFRIPQKPSAIYATEQFLDVAFRSNLTGMRFTKVWPIEAGIAPEVKEVPVAFPGMSVAEATGQSIHFNVLPADTGNVDAGRIDLLADELRMILLPSESHLFAVGHLEYVEEDNGTYRLVFSCADATILSKMLSEYLTRSKLNLKVQILERKCRYDVDDKRS